MIRCASRPAYRGLARAVGAGAGALRPGGIAPLIDGRDLDPDLYHYRGDDHVLVALGAPTVAATMLTDCAVAWGQPDQPPQALVVISSRLPRLAWKYEGIAYKLSLLNAGAAIANLHLVITDMGLAGCAAGSGNPELFAAATGSDPWEETSIAEFGFGRPGG